MFFASQPGSMSMPAAVRRTANSPARRFNDACDRTESVGSASHDGCTNRSVTNADAAVTNDASRLRFHSRTRSSLVSPSAAPTSGDTTSSAPIVSASGTIAPITTDTWSGPVRSGWLGTVVEVVAVVEVVEVVEVVDVVEVVAAVDDVDALRVGDVVDALRVGNVVDALRVGDVVDALRVGDVVARGAGSTGPGRGALRSTITESPTRMRRSAADVSPTTPSPRRRTSAPSTPTNVDATPASILRADSGNE